MYMNIFCPQVVVHACDVWLLCVDIMSNDAEFVNSDCKICVISLPETPSLRYEFICVCVCVCVCVCMCVCVYY